MQREPLRLVFIDCCDSEFCADQRLRFLDARQLPNFFNDATGQGEFFVCLYPSDEVVFAE